ncbi:MAG: tetratricopeptide repeat protein [Candidatus Sulfotelmatobacter sp.]
MFYTDFPDSSVNPATARRDYDHRLTRWADAILRFGPRFAVTFVTLPASSRAGYVSEGLSEKRFVTHSRRALTAIHELGNPVRIKASLLFIFALAILAAPHSDAQTENSRAITTTQIAAWLTGGVSSSRLARLVNQRGLAYLPTHAELLQLKSIGADKDLFTVISSGNAESAKIGPAIPEALLNAAAKARLEQYHAAELDLRKIADSDSNDSAIHFALGVMLRQQEQWDDADDELNLALKLMPDLPENHSALAYLFYRLDDGPNSIAEARTALSIDPQNAEAYQYLGLGQYSVGDYQAAIHAYSESLLRDRDNADTYYDMGIALHAAGNLPRAIAAYEKAIQLRPAFWEAHSNLALIRHEEGNFAAAVAEYREAKRLAPDEASVRNNLGNTYCDEGKYDAAIAEMKDLYREHPDWQQGHSCLASAYMAKNNYDAAVEQLQFAVLQNPEGSAEHRILGQALMLDNKPEEALHELRIAVELNPDSDVAHHLLGTVLFQQQQFAAAEKEFREALRVNASADNHYSLAACLMSMDRYQEALSELEVASRLDPERQLYRARREELIKLMKNTSTR